MGGSLLQQVNRDTFKFAFKASAGFINDEWRDIKKTVVTEPFKESKAGRMKLTNENGVYKTVPIDADGNDVLKTVFKNGKLIKKYTFEDIRNRAGWREYYG
jgi:nicotinamide phosphoribosyltransferase